MLDERDRSYLRGLRWRRRAAIAVGLVFTLAGGFYAVWGAGQFRSELGTEVRREPSAVSWDWTGRPKSTRCAARLPGLLPSVALRTLAEHWQSVV